MKIEIVVNGTATTAEVEPRLLLAHYLRDVLGLRATNIGCDTTSCGACTVLLDGESVKSCTLLAAQADGLTVITLEGLSPSVDELHPVAAAFRAEHGLQCGFCTPGMVLAAVSLLAENPAPTEREVREGLEGNLCRCTGYHNIVRAILVAAGQNPDVPAAAGQDASVPAAAGRDARVPGVAGQDASAPAVAGRDADVSAAAGQDAGVPAAAGQHSSGGAKPAAATAGGAGIEAAPGFHTGSGGDA